MYIVLSCEYLIVFKMAETCELVYLVPKYYTCISAWIGF